MFNITRVKKSVSRRSFPRKTPIWRKYVYTHTLIRGESRGFFTRYWTYSRARVCTYKAGQRRVAIERERETEGSHAFAGSRCARARARDLAHAKFMQCCPVSRHSSASASSPASSVSLSRSLVRAPFARSSEWPYANKRG